MIGGVRLNGNYQIIALLIHSTTSLLGIAQYSNFAVTAIILYSSFEPVFLQGGPSNILQLVTDDIKVIEGRITL